MTGLHALLLSTVLLLAHGAQAELVPYQATLELRVSAGTNLTPVTVVDASFSGMAEIDAGVLRIGAGALSTPVATLSGFGGVLVNGPLTLSAGGAGAGATCPLTAIQERCIPGAGFGGVMPLSGVSQRGQGLAVWGAGANATGTTSLGLSRVVMGTRWTTGTAQAWFYVPELDPTPFLHSAAGSFAGLPSTFTGPGDAGLRVVTPMVVTGSSLASDPNARGVAVLTIRFEPRPLPLGLGVVLAAALIATGLARTRTRHPLG